MRYFRTVSEVVIDSSLATNNGWEFGTGNVGIWVCRNKSTTGIDARKGSQNEGEIGEVEY